MKKVIALLIAGSVVLNYSFAQETLQSVTDRGSITTNPITLSVGSGDEVLRLHRSSGFIAGYNNAGSVRNGYLEFGNAGTGTGVGGDGNNPVSLVTKGLIRAIVLPDGNVGVGTTSPVEKLHVMGNIRSEGLVRFYTPYVDAGGTSGIVANPNGWTRIDPNGGRFIMTVFKEDVEAARNILDIERVDTWQKLMELKADGSGFFQGNIGIGTTTPQSKLAVNGNITTKKIKVTQIGWPDYVFDSSYQLPSLSHVETFITENKHLPEVPSAAEVKKDGLDLGDTQVVLLKKIEELTLYIIQQNKEITELKKRVSDIEVKQPQ
ncbi:hypothetical protein [Filimonas effusa]|uniref:Tail fiber domain-containing protein n=1 Tax=Filimonas effusa TaxID=2508721 RepID=A0A4Q1D3B7_9BACT|nr:hypothetical protein [Filimonas effusa]RXK82902.1 hypothetical protein ESB13_12295 [Filimonas effusa]